MSVPTAAAPQPPPRSTRAGPFLPIIALLVVCAPIFFFRLGRPGLGDPDEGRNAEAAREMLESGDWVTPHMDGVVYLDKPPAFFWVVALSYALFGVGELSARAPSALFALATIVLVFMFARSRLGETGAWLAGLTLALSPLFIVFGRIVIFDMMLTFCMTVAIFAAFEALESDSRRVLPAALFFASAGLGTICKGPVALIVPLLVAVVWALVRGRPRALGRLRFGTEAAVLHGALLDPRRHPRRSPVGRRLRAPSRRGGCDPRRLDPRADRHRNPVRRGRIRRDSRRSRGTGHGIVAGEVRRAPVESPAL